MTPDGQPASTTTGLGDFDIGRMLGEGASATVSVATHRTFGGRVALKLWRQPLHEPSRRRFLEECQLQWQLSEHPHVVRLYWADARPGRAPWLAMELYEGSLAERLSRPGPPPDEAALLIVVEDFLSGLAAIHDRGHVHRDVKPANILLKDGRAAIGDLGLAMALHDRTADRAAGTGHYVAPELLRYAAPDFRSDVYSAGRTIEATFGTDLPSWLEPFVTRATSANPSDRPADATELLARFRQVRPTEPAGPPSGPPARASEPVQPVRRRLMVRRRGTVVAAAGSSLTALAVATVLLTPAGGRLAALAAADAPISTTAATPHPGATVAASASPAVTATAAPTTTGPPPLAGFGPATVSTSTSMPSGTGGAGGIQATPKPPTTEPGGSTGGNTEPRAVETARPKASTALYTADFRSSVTGWKTGPVDVGTMTFTADRYRLQIQQPGYAVWSTSPSTKVAGAMRISATAHLSSGQGGWGVWCRGSGGQRYEFTLTHGRAAYIVTPSTSTPPVTVDGFDVYEDHRLDAECSDSAGGVMLRLKVDGRTVVSHLETGTLLGAGQTGLHAFAFGDVDGPLADARFASYSTAKL